MFFSSYWRANAKEDVLVASSSGATELGKWIFVVDAGGRSELFEAKWTELPYIGDTINLDCVRNIVDKSRVAAATVVCRTANESPLPKGFRAYR